MKKAIFVSQKEATIKKVYSDKTISKLKKNLIFLNDVVVNSKNLGQYKDFICDTEYIFTTWGMFPLSCEDIQKYFSNLKVIFYAAGSVQYFAREYLECGVRISSAWVANAYPVAEFTVSQILLANKGYFRTVRQMKKNDPKNAWAAAGRAASEYCGNYKAKVGLLGIGATGERVAELLHPFNIEIYAFDPFLSEEKARRLNIKKAAPEYIFENCTVISNHIANLPSTVGMLDSKYFDLMQDNATFINTGRGQQLVEKDLISALKEKPERTALLDVTYPEPPLSESELYALDNVFMTPHIAGSTNNECYRMSEFMYEEYLLYESEGKLKYEVTKNMLESMA